RKQLEDRVNASNENADVSDVHDGNVTNTAYHDGLNNSYRAGRRHISGAKNSLKRGGKLSIVANDFLPYPELLDSTFGQHKVLAQTGKFKVYLAKNA
ncbi:methyltransferase, partial [Morganella morganii]|uniref:methyltransferase n=1 Tax=Morganella morganii TaxID=582 RepID=UPI0015F5702F